jgi:hypothetical protein
MEPDDSDSVTELVGERARACAEYVRRSMNINLDYSAETLPLVDHYLSTARAQVLERPSFAPLIAEAAGAYFGSVAVSALGGFWRIPSGNVHDWQICMKNAFLSINPIGVGYEALFSSSTHAGPRALLHVAPEYRKFVDARLASLPETREDEYFLLSTRLEVLETAILELRAHMEAEGYGDTLYEAEDYAAELRPLGLN